MFGQQYDFNSQSSSQDSSQGSSQEPKVYCAKQKNETDVNDTEIENLTITEIEECDGTTQSSQDSCHCAKNHISQVQKYHGKLKKTK